MFNSFIIIAKIGGAWVAQSAKGSSLDFSSPYHLRIIRSNPASGSELSEESA